MIWVIDDLRVGKLWSILWMKKDGIGIGRGFERWIGKKARAPIEQSDFRVGPIGDRVTELGFFFLFFGCAFIVVLCVKKRGVIESMWKVLGEVNLKVGVWFLGLLNLGHGWGEP